MHWWREALKPEEPEKGLPASKSPCRGCVEAETEGNCGVEAVEAVPVSPLYIVPS
jgi:hypothetical protein